MERFKKLLATGVLFTTILSMSMVVAPVKAAAQPGDLIKMNGLSSVYYLGADGKRYVFPNEQTYFSWYNDFSGVVTVPQSELESYPLGKNVTMRPGTNLVKITTDPKVYAVEPNGNLVWVSSEAVASGLWGSNWAKRVVDVPDAFFTNYTVNSAKQVSATAYPTGSLVKFSGAADVYYIAADGKARKIADEASFVANRFDWNDVVTSTLTKPTEGTPISGVDASLVDTSSGAGGVAGSGTGLSVALSSATAPASSLIVGQAAANLASFNLTAANDGAVTVNTIKLKRIGISADATLSDVYLYEGANRLTDGASVSSGYILFNNLGLSIPAGQTKTLTVKAKMAGAAGESIGVSINAATDIEASGAVVSGSFPVSGNLHSMAAATLATVAFNASTLPSTANVTAGETDYTTWKNTVAVGTRKVYLESIKFRQIGSIAATDVKNFRFYVDGVQKGEAQNLGTDNYLTFNFATPVTLETGSRVLEVRANVENGASKTFSLSVRYAVDVLVKDSEYGAYISSTGLAASSGTQSILAGTLSVAKATDSPSGDVVKDATGVTLAKFEFKAYGENVKVEYLKVSANSSDASIGKLRNGTLYANGVQIGSTADLGVGTATTTYNLGSSLIVKPGTPVIVEVRADIYDNDGTNNVSADDTFTVILAKYTNAGQLSTSAGTIDVPSADVPASQVTVKTGTLTLSKTSAYGNQTMVAPQTAYKVGSFVLTGNASEDVTLNTINVGLFGTGAMSTADLSDVYVKYGTKTTSVKSTVSTATSTFSVSDTLAKSANMTIEVYATIGSNVNANDTLRADLNVVGTTQQSSTAVDKYAQGQTITVGSASITSALDSSSKDSAIVKGGTSVDAAAFKFTTSNDEYTISEVVVKFTGTNGPSAISTVDLLDGTTVLATSPVNGTSATFSGLTVTAPANADKSLTVRVNLGTIGTGAGSTGADITATLDSFKAAPKSTGTSATDTADRAGNALYVYKGIPTITLATLPTTLLAAGTQTISKFTVAADGEVAWKRLVFTYASSTAAITITNPKIYFDSTEISGSTCTRSLAAKTVTCELTTEQVVAAGTSKTYSLKADIGGTVGTGDSIQTSIAKPTGSFAASANYDAQVSAAASFIWSDRSAASHATSTTDWSTDFLVKNLPTDSQSMSK